MFITRFTILTVACYFGVAVNVPAQAQAQSNSSSLSDKLVNGFSPPQTDNPAPENTQGGATRGLELGFEERAPDRLAPNNLAPDRLAPNSLAPKELSPDELAPKPLTSSPTDLTNW
jgi:hypothetical protein